MPFLKDEKKKLLLDRYLDIEWPNDVIDLRCVYCKRVAIIHYVSKCQHLFCNICRKMLSDEGQWLCPQCQEHVTQLDDRNFDVELKIQKLRIFCPNKKYGCNNEDQLRNIPKHLMKCVATPEASLPVESTGANTMDVVVNKLTYENAAIEELKEGVNLKLSKQVKTFDDVNSQLKVLTDRMYRMEKKSEKRIMQLELAFGKCIEEFRSFKSLLESVNQRVKQNESHHQKVMEQMWFNMEKTRTKMASMTQEMETLPIQKSEEPNSMRVETYEWTIKDVAKKTPNETWRIISETFNFTGYPFQIRAKLKKQRIAKIYLEFNEGKSLTNLVQKNGFTTVKYIFKDQSDNLKKRDVILETNLLFYGCFGQKSLIFGRHLSPDHLYLHHT